MEIFPIIKAIFVVLYVLFLPGFFVSLIFIDLAKMEVIERVILSVALSIGSIPVLAFYLNLMGLKISPQNLILEILIVILLAIGILYLKYVLSFFKRDSASYLYRKRSINIEISKEDHEYPLRTKTHTISLEAFQIFLVTYLCFLLIETVKPGFVSFFFNINIMLVLVLISGIVMVATLDEGKKYIIPAWSLNNILRLVERGRLTPSKKKLSKINQYFIYGLSLGGGVLVYYETEVLGGLSIMIALVTIATIYLISKIIVLES